MRESASMPKGVLIRELVSMPKGWLILCSDGDGIVLPTSGWRCDVECDVMLNALEM